MMKKIFLLLVLSHIYSFLFAQSRTREDEIRDLTYLVDTYGGSAFMEDSYKTTIFCDIRADGRGIDYYYRGGLYFGQTITAIGTVSWANLCGASIVWFSENPKKQLIEITLKKKIKVQINYLDRDRPSETIRVGYIYFAPTNICELDVKEAEKIYENVLYNVKGTINRLSVYNSCK